MKERRGKVDITVLRDQKAICLRASESGAVKPRVVGAVELRGQTGSWYGADIITSAGSVNKSEVQTRRLLRDQLYLSDGNF